MPATRPRRAPTRRRRGRKQADNWWPLAIVAVLVVVGVAWARGADDLPAPITCTVDGAVGTGDVQLTADQAENAATIARVGRERGLPDRAIVIALATAMQESTLRNLPYGDRDSLGLFQQRPSQGWGTPAQVQDPVYAASIFYDRLVQVPGWDSGRLTEVAQAVQRSGFPEAYQKHEPLAQELTVALSANALGCS